MRCGSAPMDHGAETGPARASPLDGGGTNGSRGAAWKWRRRCQAPRVGRGSIGWSFPNSPSMLIPAPDRLDVKVTTAEMKRGRGGSGLREATPEELPAVLA